MPTDHRRELSEIKRFDQLVAYLRDETGWPIEVEDFEDLTFEIYAVFHSPSYRSRYAEFLKIDFPRLPLPGSIELFHALGLLGGELVALHLLESPTLDHPIIEFIDSGNPEIDAVIDQHGGWPGAFAASNAGGTGDAAR